MTYPCKKNKCRKSCDYFYLRMINNIDDMTPCWHILIKCNKYNKVLKEFDMEKLGALSPFLCLAIEDEMKEFKNGN